MVHLITGPIDSGKTTLAMALYRKHGGGGFCCPKVFENHRLIGYDLLDLARRRSIPWIRTGDMLPEGWEDVDRIGPWRFNRKGLEMARQVIEGLLADRTEPIFLDEIGPLELLGRGFAPLLIPLTTSGLACWLVVREELMTDVIRRFQLHTDTIRKTGGRLNHD